ncbi:MAG: hypothetical protein M1839_001022 [Geoglossum umbratile]|nr:MAG: hypothetical protein M1839_001022 [Geoglossum umbratile]
MDAVQTLGHTAAQSGKSIKEVIADYLRPWTKERQLDELLKIFNNGCDLDEIMSEVVFEAWNYIQNHRLWTIRYQDLESLRRDIQYDDFIAKRIDHHKVVTNRKRTEGMNIYKTWGCLPQDAFPESINPPWFSDRLLRGLNQLSRHCSFDRKEALPLLGMAIKDRLSDPDAANRSKSIQYLTLNDVTKALKLIKNGGGELAKQANTGESPMAINILDAEASLNLITGSSVGGEGGGGKNKDHEVEAADSMDEEGATDSVGEEGREDERTKTKEVLRAGKMKTKARTTRTKLLAEDDEVEAADPVNEEGAPDSIEEEGFTNSVGGEGAAESAGEEGAADSVDGEGAPSAVEEEGAANSVDGEGAAGSAGEEGAADSVEEGVREDEQIEARKVPRASKIETKASTTRTKPPAEVLRCGCASICSAFLSRITPIGIQLDDNEGLGLLEWSYDLQWANFCKNHLRRLAGSGLGMYTNITKTELLKRLKLVFHYCADLNMVRTKKPRYFRRASRVPGSVTARLGPYMYTPKKSDTFTFNAKLVFNRFAGCANAWDTFQEDGTINIDGVFDYILKPEIFKLIEEEFDMYLYHLRDEQGGQKRRGWMRHMFYSLVQQLVRQDPVYYALTAAARPDKNTWLICYPYYVKYQVEGDSTGFAHLDINVDCWLLSAQRKKNRGQIGVSVIVCKRFVVTCLLNSLNYTGFRPA